MNTYEKLKRLERIGVDNWTDEELDWYFEQIDRETAEEIASSGTLPPKGDNDGDITEK